MSALLKGLKYLRAVLPSLAVLGTIGGLFYWSHTHAGPAGRSQTAAAATPVGPDLDVQVTPPGGGGVGPEPSGCPGNRTRVEFRSADVLHKLGLEVGVARQRPMDQFLT